MRIYHPQPYAYRLIALLTMLGLQLSALASSSSDLQPGHPSLARREMSAGSSCSGSEGQWNCMTNSFQRCAAGVWSVTQDCADGTVCTPSGLNYEFHVDFSSSYASGGASTSGTVPSAYGGMGAGACTANWWSIGMLGIISIWLVAA
ncbi:hypothetical protein F5Y15DRAFT_14440 [Xylariaceae sp. FL0016]|nr:hypothetical protein F5Y15DRAFT_14440 [Xylariaceae sp. FL0016]